MLLLRIVDRAFYVYSIILVLYALLSWLPNAYDSKIGQIIIKLARPYLDIFDRFIPPIGGISFNVIIALFALQFIQAGLQTLIRMIIF